MPKTNAKPRMLVIAKTPALHDRSGNDQRLFRFLRALAPAIEIDFVATNHAMRNLEEKINKTDAYYAVRDGNFRRERFEFLESGYFEDLRQVGVNPLNDPLPRPLTLRPTNDYDLTEYLAGKVYDLVWIEYFYIADRYLNEIRRFQPWAKVYVDSVDLHYLRLERQAHHLAQNVKFVVNVKQERAELPADHQAKVVEHYAYAAQVKSDELSVYNRADTVIAASPDDREKLLERFPPEKILLLPQLYDDLSTSPGPEKRRGLLLAGNFDHHPNVTAAIYLKHEVSPLLDARKFGPLHLVGNNPLYLIKTMQKRGSWAGKIKVTGYVKNLKSWLDRALVSLAPIFFDSGSSTKIGEALSAGVPVVTTPLGAELMGLTPEENCLVGRTPVEFAQQIERLTKDHELWQRLRMAGQKFIHPFTESENAGRVREAFLTSFRPEKIRAHQIVKPLPPRSRPLVLPAARFPKFAKPQITVLLVTYNQWPVTELCLRSLAYAQRKNPQLAVEYLLVDNASADGTAARAARVPGLRVIRNKKNLGFAAGNNVGIRAARGRDVVLLNNDTVVSPDWLRNLHHHARTIPDLGILGPSTNTETAQQVAGAHYNSVAELFAYNEALARKSGGMWDVITKVSGLCFYLPRHTIEQVGLLDEGFGIGYFEDDDYCLRTRDAGLKLVCAKDVYVHHFGNMSFEGNSLNRTKILEKGMSRFIFKWGRRAIQYIELNHKNTDLQFVDPKTKTSF